MLGLYLTFLLTGQLALFLYLRRGLKHFPTTNPAKLTQEPLAILIPHYNDAEKISLCLEALEPELTRYQATIYIIDDHSQPHELKALQTRVKDFQVWSSPASPGKKNALKWARQQIKEDIIIQLDADCIVHHNAIGAILTSFNAGADLVLCRAEMEANNGFWSNLASLDFHSLQLVGLSTAIQGKVSIASAALIAYRRKAVNDIITEGDQWASGDDTFLVQALAENPAVKIVVNPSAAVRTAAPATLSEFLKQRLRWGSKSVAYPSFFAKLLALQVALINANIVAFVGLSLVALISPIWLLYLWVPKLILDYLLLSNYEEYCGKSLPFHYYLSLALVYPFYITTVLVMMLLPLSFTWKGRPLRIK